MWSPASRPSRFRNGPAHQRSAEVPTARATRVRQAVRSLHVGIGGRVDASPRAQVAASHGPRILVPGDAPRTPRQPCYRDAISVRGTSARSIVFRYSEWHLSFCVGMKV